MKAVVVNHPGPPDALILTELHAPALAPGQVRIAVSAVSVNWADIQRRQDQYPQPMTFPCVLGMEVSGTVVECHDDVPADWLGKRVAAICGERALGGYAEEVCVPVEYLAEIPDGVDDVTAAALLIAPLTAFHILESAHHTKPGEVIVVHSAAGSVGLALTQVATRLGAKVIGTVGDRSRVSAVEAVGAAGVVVRGDEDFVDRVMTVTDGRGADLVVDSLGGEVLQRSFSALRTFGGVINIGEASGIPNFDIRGELYRNSTWLAGFELLHAVPGSPRWQEGLDFVVSAVESGALSIPIGEVRPLAEAAHLHELMESRRGVGKPVLLVRE